MARPLALTFAGAWVALFLAVADGLPLVPAAIVGALFGLVGSRFAPS